ncbi:aspartate/glutamate racemase family protein [Candidatus Entotheonella palauensis]|nr:aspartate/glutamate racemase family protein [Candidatus Entotheonella palauensis]
MKLLVVNPNTTASMTAKIGAAARSVAAAGTEIVAVNPERGPVSIEGYYDEVFSVPGLLEEIAKGQAAGCQGVIIACFDDTGLDAARALAHGPVVGICEAAMHLSTLLGGSFSVVTTLPRSVPAIEALARRYGMSHHCRRVRAAEVPVLALEDPASDASARIRAEIAAALDEDRAECIILGCAGMADFARSLTAEFGLPVIDGVAAAVKLVESMVSLGLATSKIGGYAAPLPKPYQGDFACYQPQTLMPPDGAKR